MKQDRYSSTNIMNLLKNAAFKFGKRYDLLENLSRRDSFDSYQQYYDLYFPLLQNECYNEHLKQLKNVQNSLVDQAQDIWSKKAFYPQIYRLRCNDEFGQTQDDGARLDCIGEEEYMPQMGYTDETNTWKYRHYSQYLLFREMSNFIVALHFWNEEDKLLSTLGYYHKSQDEEFIVIPYQTEFRRQLPEYEFLSFFQPICSISAYRNEAQALSDAQDCPYLNLILNPTQKNNLLEPTIFSEKVDIQKEKYFQNEIFTNNFDPDQLNAINGAVNFEQKISIIEGPPGTGKTQTTIGIISIMADLLKDPEDNKKGCILVLAKSNSVVNDLVRKINANIEEENSIIFCEKDKPTFLKLVRIGRAERCDNDIEKFSLEIRSQHYFFTTIKQEQQGDLEKECMALIEKDLARLQILYFRDFLKTQKLYFSIFSLLRYIDDVNAKTCNKNVLDALGNYYHQLSQMLKKGEKDYKETKQMFLAQCNIIVTTLNSCSHECLLQYFEKMQFRMCIVDEAPTALEPSLLIPFVKYPNLQKIVLLGDQRQLRPITTAKQSKEYGYNRPMFTRFAKHLTNVYQLEFQYRQMPNLAQITSLIYYDGRLKDGVVNMQFPVYIQTKVSAKRNRLFFNTPSRTENQYETSRQNTLETKAIFALVKYLLFENKDLEKKITIISAYKAQKDSLKKLLKKDFKDRVDFDTVDSFQGKENDIIILSLVRSNNQFGFVGDKNRTNVALSRARFCQFIFGTKTTLERNLSNWRKVIKLLELSKEIIEYTEKNLENNNFFKQILKQEEEQQQ